MMRALGIAATGMQAMQTNVEVISNNIANVNTTGFKRGLASVPGSALPVECAGRQLIVGQRHGASHRHPRSDWACALPASPGC